MKKRNRQYTFAFIDVGQGDSTFILNDKEMKAIIIDIGLFDPVLPFLNKCNTIEAIFISHSHIDHTGGLAELLDWIKCCNQTRPILYINKQNFSGKRNARIARGIHQASKDKIIKIMELYSDKNNHVKIIDGNIHVLWPPFDEFYSSVDNKNCDCQILLFESGALRTIFGGDATGEVWPKIPLENIRANILKYPHHGGKLKKGAGSWDSKQLIKKVNPEYVILSHAKSNKYNHPSTGVKKERLSQINRQFLSTADNGTIKLKIEACSGSICQLG